MRKIFGWLLLVVGFFLIGMLLSKFLSARTEPVSPIPDDEVRVLMLSPQPIQRE